MKSEGSRRAELLLSLLKRKEKVISTLLIGNSLANTLCTIMATSLFIEFLGDDLGTLVSSIVMSFSIIVFSEVVPKAIAVAKPEKIALIATPMLLVFSFVSRRPRSVYTIFLLSNFGDSCSILVFSLLLSP